MDLTSKADIIITYAKAFDIPGENGKETLKGCSVHYFFLGENGSGFKPVHSIKIDEAVGYQRAKVSLDYDLRAKIPCAPGIYEGSFVMSVGSEGKPVLKLVDVQFVKELELKLVGEKK